MLKHPESMNSRGAGRFLLRSRRVAGCTVVLAVASLALGAPVSGKDGEKEQISMQTGFVSDRGELERLTGDTDDWGVVAIVELELHDD